MKLREAFMYRVVQNTFDILAGSNAYPAIIGSVNKEGDFGNPQLGMQYVFINTGKGRNGHVVINCTGYFEQRVYLLLFYGKQALGLAKALFEKIKFREFLG